MHTDRQRLVTIYRWCWVGCVITAVMGALVRRRGAGWLRAPEPTNRRSGFYAHGATIIDQLRHGITQKPPRPYNKSANPLPRRGFYRAGDGASLGDESARSWGVPCSSTNCANPTAGLSAAVAIYVDPLIVPAHCHDGHSVLLIGVRLITRISGAGRTTGRTADRRSRSRFRVAITVR